MTNWFAPQWILITILTVQMLTPFVLRYGVGKDDSKTNEFVGKIMIQWLTMLGFISLLVWGGFF